jgi:hypothetical protein
LLPFYLHTFFFFIFVVVVVVGLEAAGDDVIKTIDCHSHDSLHSARHIQNTKEKRKNNNNNKEEEENQKKKKKKTRLTLFLGCCHYPADSFLPFAPCVSPWRKFHSPEKGPSATATTTTVQRGQRALLGV